MITESQIEYCLARIRVQLTPVTGHAYNPNIEAILNVVRETIALANGKTVTHDTDSVHSIGLLDRTSSILEQAGYETVGALRKATPKLLLEIDNIGPLILEEIRESLRRRGQKLAGEVSCADAVRGYLEKRARKKSLGKART